MITGLTSVMALSMYQPNQRVTVDLSNLTIQGVSFSQNVQKAPGASCGRSRRSRPFTWSSSCSASRGLTSWRSPGSGCERRKEGRAA